MSEVLRLIRLSLLLRLVPALAGAIGAIATGRPIFALLAVIVALPSLTLFAVAGRLSRNRQPAIRAVRILLALTLALYLTETLVMSLISRQLISSGAVPIDAAPRRFDLSEESNNAAIPLFFALIPTVLGAWIDGRRGWWRWAGGVIVLAIITVSVIAQPPAGSPFGFVALAIVTSMVCYFVASLADQQRAEHAQLEAANRKLAEQAQIREQLATTRERVRLSRDLHDTVAHKLAALAVQMNAIDVMASAERSATHEGLSAELAKAKTLVKEGLDDTRRAIGDLRVNQVNDLGLASALQRLAESATSRGAFNAAFRQTGEETSLPPETANAMYYIAQEALNNIERHAQAQEAQIVLEWRSQAHNAVILSISEEGVGFDPNAPADSERFGLTGMRERAELAGAHIRISSRSGAGTTVQVEYRNGGAVSR